ncbi:PREDICTED: uncharacterized protein LOC108972981 [Bactrocera latifrons]|uniref:Proline-rich transmembrane protein 3/4 domain-containing protein n=2 Tax=Bactrocera latifrons TaxID=174628 RepID=A0A0K8VQ57_BACLA|nr:PREDICTED: uncharacterized protein LOC108972981 [Bactrocera latifrons]XP_018795487.1 PREDICTED: uncharacterized protein LOC108972981 [Bactrocera latifrons]XP_018795488.1 PREDICTED: uncharacterized protein LOC108972981 [Bactrocera latifrons]XP_018795490.1 PREDICTED: uncharacterized protein LOC108972981 [Bactrocera latifrons]XP_018795491.1 PREDICTED: uncharacterized protein LOC108972981 [Bactrocera latifrons]
MSHMLKIYAMRKRMILSSTVNAFESPCEHTTKNFELKDQTSSASKIGIVSGTERSSGRPEIEGSYARYNKKKKEVYEHCKYYYDNSRLQTDSFFPITRLKLLKNHLINGIWQESIQPEIATNSSHITQNPRCSPQRTEADVYSGIVEQVHHDDSCIIKSRLFLPDFQSLKFLNEFTSVYNGTISTNWRCDYNSSINRLHAFEENSNANKQTCANDVSSGGFHQICCVSLVSGKAEISKGKTNEISSKNLRKIRTGVAGTNGILNTNTIHYILLILLSLSQVRWTHALLLVESKYVSPTDDDYVADSNNNNPYMNTSIPSESSNRIRVKPGMAVGGVIGGISSLGSSGYMDKMKMNNLERSVAAVLKKVAYGTTSTTKRSIPDKSYLPRLTTIATPLLTTLRYAEKSSQQQQINHHHRNYELDLERDHALPTSAPNADILKSNSNPTYPNPNRHHNHERERNRHVINSTPSPSIPNILKKNNGQLPSIPMFPGDMPSYSPPARSFFTPPLPPEYQNPFADKPTLRGTNNEGIILNTGTYINRRPIPPPSLMPGHERIPFRPPDLAASTGNNSPDVSVDLVQTGNSSDTTIPLDTNADADRKKSLNTPYRGSAVNNNANLDNINVGGVIHTMTSDATKNFYGSSNSQELPLQSNNSERLHGDRQEVLPSIRRILSGANGKGDIPEVLLKQATSRPIVNYNQPPSSPGVLLDGSNVAQHLDSVEESGISSISYINKSKNSPTLNRDTEIYDSAKVESGEHKYPLKTNAFNEKPYGGTIGSSNGNRNGSTSTPSTAAAIGGQLGVNTAAATSTTSTIISGTVGKYPTLSAPIGSSKSASDSGSSATSSSTAAAASPHSTWAVAWNIHVYFSVVLFTILAVYSLYKVLTYNKLTHLFSQSYFMCINLVLIVICSARIFYLCYDAYNIHATFNLFISELLLNLPATLLTISFSVLILYLFLKALNHKNNRYSALIRPLTVVVGCGVHVLLCITLHYVESYTLQNQQQQHLLYQQQQQQLHYRRQQQLLHQHHHQHQQFISAATTNLLVSAAGFNSHSALFLQSAASAPTSNTSPPRVLSLICQIIYIFVCLFLGLLYLYLYRILKRILHSKSQNYIHGYQNLSYAIHITIATALLFVLLAALQIFGAISISTTRPLIQQLTAEIDWLQWGYQFSLRLIEIAIITLLSWVAGLKTSAGSSGVSVSVNAAANGDSRYGVAGENGGGNVVFGSGTVNHNREKHGHHHFHHNHSNMAGFFLPCTSSSSQEQIDTDYPAVCNANTNLHTYTMRTGKLIYDDSFALNSLSGNGQSQLNGVGNSTIPAGNRNISEFQLQTQPTYQRPYDSGSINSAIADEYGTQSTLAGGGGGACGRYSNEVPQYTDYLTDVTTDHYENPNFDLHGSVSGSGFGVSSANPSAVQKFTKTSTTSTTASSSAGSGSSATSQQQMLLLQSDSCYSEPLQPAHTSSYEFNNFERPHLGTAGAGPSSDCWSDPHTGQPLSRIIDNYKSKRQKKIHTTLDRDAYENPERRSSNSTHSCASSRYGAYNSFDRGFYNGIRKSGTLNNIVGNGNGGGHMSGIGIMHDRNSSSSSAASSNISAQRASGSQTTALSSEKHLQQRNGRGNIAGVVRDRNQDGENEQLFSRSSLDRNITHPQHQHQHKNPDDTMSSGIKVERSNLIDNVDGSCIANSNSAISFCGGHSQMSEINVGNSKASNLSFEQSNLKNNTHSNSFMLQKSYHNHQQQLPVVVNTTKQQKRPDVSLCTANSNLSSSESGAHNSGTSNTSVTSSTASEGSSSRSKDSAMLVAERGFVRFRAIDDINNAQGIGIHNASVRN